MSKAEERAFERCPKSENATEEMRNERKRAIFTEGYRQAEKDMELTVEDIELICEIEYSLCSSENKLPSREAFYQEILKQIKERKLK